MVHLEYKFHVIWKVLQSVNFTCVGMYGRGPDNCENANTKGYQIMIRNNSTLYPLCNEGNVCDCCDQKGCHVVTMVHINCVPVNQIPLKDQVCFVDSFTNQAYLTISHFFFAFVGVTTCCCFLICDNY